MNVDANTMLSLVCMRVSLARTALLHDDSAENRAVSLYTGMHTRSEKP